VVAVALVISKQQEEARRQCSSVHGLAMVLSPPSTASLWGFSRLDTRAAQQCAVESWVGSLHGNSDGKISLELQEKLRSLMTGLAKFEMMQHLPLQMHDD
jgi:hypothetical protein